MKQLFAEIPTLSGARVTLRPLVLPDAPALSTLTQSERVYRYLPTFLFEKQYPDARTVIGRLYTECLDGSLILGVFEGDAFLGLAEFYGYRKEIKKISVGYRFLERAWGRGIATETLGVMIDFLFTKTDIEIVTASTMLANAASAGVLKKNGFSLVVHDVPEDWGYPEPTPTDKWIR